MKHPINPETRKAFEEEFGNLSIWVLPGHFSRVTGRDKAGNVLAGQAINPEELLQFIADREHEAEERSKLDERKRIGNISAVDIYATTYNRKQAVVTKTLRELYPDIFKALTDKESA